MLNTILATKKGMSQQFVGDTRTPVTYLQAGPCVVTQVKTQDKDGYWALQLGFDSKKLKNIAKPQIGHLKAVTKDNKRAARFLREVRLEEKPDLKVGDEVLVSGVLKKGDKVAVTATSKGKGFAGVVKRWKFAGGPRTHGQSDRLRAPGSIGQGTDPGRVWKGKKMAGRMGSDTVTVKNLIVVDVDKEANMVALSGPVPGPRGSLVIIKKIASGSLDDLIEEAPEIQVQEEPEKEGKEESNEEQKGEQTNE